MSDDTTVNAVELATELTIAWLSNQNNRVSAEDVPVFLRRMHATIGELEAGGVSSDVSPATNAVEQEHTPAVTVRKSLASKDHIISMIDGKPYRALRRHLSKHGLTPDQYRERYNLKPDYPMVASSYSEARRAMAKQIELGFKGRKARVEEAPAAEPKPKRTRKAPATTTN